MWAPFIGKEEGLGETCAPQAASAAGDLFLPGTCGEGEFLFFQLSKKEFDSHGKISYNHFHATSIKS